VDSACVENQGREVMAQLVHDLISEAMRLDLHGAPAERVEKANGAQFGAGASRNRNG
jgi:hypothetical protein